MQNKERLRKYVDEEWNDDCAYTSHDIADLLQCDSRVARYYLMCMVKIGKLCQIKYRSRTYYVKPDKAEIFDQFKNIGLRII